MVDVLGPNGKRIATKTTYKLGPGKMYIQNERSELEAILYVEQVQCASCGTVIAMPARHSQNEPPNYPSPCPNPQCRGIDTYQEVPRAPGSPPPRTFNPEAAFFLSWMCATRANEDLQAQVHDLHSKLDTIVAEYQELQKILVEALDARKSPDDEQPDSSSNN